MQFSKGQGRIFMISQELGNQEVLSLGTVLGLSDISLQYMESHNSGTLV